MTSISIIIPTYNRPELLREALTCCVNQTYSPSEIIVGDDSPNELTYTVVEEIQNSTPIPIRYFHNKPSLGQTKNVNMLLDVASGEKVMLLHDDDLLMTDSLETLISIFNANPEVEVAYGKQYIINEKGDIDYSSSETFNRDFYRQSQYTGFKISPLDAGISQQFPNNGYLINTKLARQIRYNIDAGDACDFDFGYRIGVGNHRTYFVDKYLGKYRLSGNSVTHSHTNNCAVKAYEILSSSEPKSELGKQIRSIRLKERSAIAITQAVKLGNRKQAISILFSPWYIHNILTIPGLKRLIYAMVFVDFRKLKSNKL